MKVGVNVMKHRIIMGIVVLLTRDAQMRIDSFPSKSISVVNRVAIPIEFNY